MFTNKQNGNGNITFLYEVEINVTFLFLVCNLNNVSSEFNCVQPFTLKHILYVLHFLYYKRENLTFVIN